MMFRGKVQLTHLDLTWINAHVLQQKTNNKTPKQQKQSLICTPAISVEYIQYFIFLQNYFAVIKF